MNSLLLGLLIVFDIVLAYFLFKKKEDKAGVELLEEIHEEHKLMQALVENWKTEREQHLQEGRELFRKMGVLAAELERELAEEKTELKESFNKMAQDWGPQLAAPLEELSKRQWQLEAIIKESEYSRQRLQSALQRGERVASLFQKDCSYQDLIQSLEEQKYNDARKLLGQGLDPLQVAKDLGLKHSEVELLQSLG